MTALKAPAPELNGLVWSPVENVFLERSGHKSMYSNEKVRGCVCCVLCLFDVVG